jgi:hypothetical protein
MLKGERWPELAALSCAGFDEPLTSRIPGRHRNEAAEPSLETAVNRERYRLQVKAVGQRELLTIDEWCRLPLAERVELVAHDRVQFLLDGRPVAASRALRDLREAGAPA